jgi:hypothetical protein
VGTGIEVGAGLLGFGFGLGLGEFKAGMGEFEAGLGSGDEFPPGLGGGFPPLPPPPPPPLPPPPPPGLVGIGVGVVVGVGVGLEGEGDGDGDGVEEGDWISETGVVIGLKSPPACCKARGGSKTPWKSTPQVAHAGSMFLTPPGIDICGVHRLVCGPRSGSFLHLWVHVH